MKTKTEFRKQFEAILKTLPEVGTNDLNIVAERENILERITIQAEKESPDAIAARPVDLINAVLKVGESIEDDSEFVRAFTTAVFMLGQSFDHQQEQETTNTARAVCKHPNAYLHQWYGSYWCPDCNQYLP